MTQKRYVITGISSGIGAATAKALRHKGDWVIGLDVDAAAHNQVDEFIRTDLSSAEQIDLALTKIQKPLHGLCNIAGLPPRAGLEAKILQVNYLGLRHLTSGLINSLQAGSAIVNLASRAGQQWAQHIDQIKKLNALNLSSDLTTFLHTEQISSTRAYNLSKEALILWTKSQTELLLNHDIRMNSISPGAVDTPILKDFANAFGEPMQKNVARAGRAGYPHEISPLVLFLLSHDSAWIKGTDISVDGGMGAFAISDLHAL